MDYMDIWPSWKKVTIIWCTRACTCTYYMSYPTIMWWTLDTPNHHMMDKAKMPSIYKNRIILHQKYPSQNTTCPSYYVPCPSHNVPHPSYYVPWLSMSFFLLETRDIANLSKKVSIIWCTQSIIYIKILSKEVAFFK